MYGLKQAGLEWYKTLRAWLISMGFESCNADSTCYKRVIGGRTVIVSGHVDDGLIAASRGYIELIIEELKRSRFKITDLGEPRHLLGCMIRRNRPTGTVTISQPAYIDSIIKHLDLEEARSVSSPMDSNIHLQRRDISLRPDLSMKNVPYLASVGSLNWCAVSTCPDISFAA